MQSQSVHTTSALSSKLHLSPKGITKLLLGAITFLFLLHLLGIGIRLPTLQVPDPATRNWTDLVDFDTEANLPTWYSSLTLLFCAVLLAFIAVSKRATKDPFRLHWIGLAVIFTFLSLDELAKIHERVMVMLISLWHLKGFFRFAWVIPGSVFVVVVAVTYWRFLLHLREPTRRLLLIAGVVFVTAVIGLEMLGSDVFDQYGKENLPYVTLSTLEELMEMLGIALFVYALLDYIQKYVGKVEVEVGTKTQN